VLLIHLDHDARHLLCVSADIFDVLIGQRFCVLAEQFPTARDRNWLRSRIRTFDSMGTLGDFFFRQHVMNK
jgi:hypothetical protein